MSDHSQESNLVKVIRKVSDNAVAQSAPSYTETEILTSRAITAPDTTFFLVTTSTNWTEFDELRIEIDGIITSVKPAYLSSLSVIANNQAVTRDTKQSIEIPVPA